MKNRLIKRVTKRKRKKVLMMKPSSLFLEMGQMTTTLQ